MPKMECPICNKEHNVQKLHRNVTVNGVTYQEFAYACGSYLFYNHDAVKKNLEAYTKAKEEMK